jgi:hypothetical protein
VFGRRRSSDARDVAKGASADLTAEVVADEQPVPAEKASGPWDAADSFPAMERVDLGSLQVPVLPGIDIQLVYAEQHGAWVTVRYQANGTTNEMQLQAFAAPKSSGLWDEVRGEITTEIGAAGGVCQERPGPFGAEVVANVPAQPGNPSAGLQPVRFAGIDGPRWFLRALFTGPAAGDPMAAAPLEGLLREVVVVRGDDPMPPRDMLELRLPPDAQKALEEQARAQQEAQEGGPQGRFSNPPNPFERGPEITETR